MPPPELPPLPPPRDEPPRPREPELRERLPLLRERALLLPDFAAPLERFAVERFALDLRAPDERLAPALADFARVERDLVPAELERDLVERLDLARVVRLRPLLDDLRAPPLRELEEDDPLLRVDAPPLLVPPLEPEAPASSDHLPDITRCAASATASAISEPSLVALAATLVAACWAVSAASSPASRILRRAAGLALIAAAAAARPAASISLLIAALASLSTVVLFERDADFARDDEERDDEEREELLRGDLAIFCLPPLRRKTL